MSNKEILSQIKRLAKLMELHGENEFKIRTYQNAVQRLERLNGNLSDMTAEELVSIDGIGQSIATLVSDTVQSGRSTELVAIEEKTPDGLLELMNFRGLGTKKLALLWNDFGITDKTAFKNLLESGKLLSVKGFGEKTVESLAAIVDFAFESEGKIYYAEAEIICNQLIESIEKSIPEVRISPVGKLRRKWEVIDNIELLVDQPIPRLTEVLAGIDFVEHNKKKSGPFSWKGITTMEPFIEVTVFPTTADKFVKDLVLKTGSPEHLNSTIGEKRFMDYARATSASTENEVYAEAGLAYCAPEIREGEWEIEQAQKNNLPRLLEMEDLKGILHNHTNYSDGQNTLTEMAEACREMGYEYVGITDHSKAASFYANGLFEERVIQQQQEMDELNRNYDDFKIFKGIEADILADGALDYDNETLASFDFVVASIHSGLSMDKTRATERLITAIANPYTTILGHMTGRILLERIGYPVDHEAIINACAEFNVVIEINSHPKRLDIDWRWVRKALDKGVTLAINPDAHEIAGYKDMYYGVCVGRKGGLTKEQILNTLNLEEISKYFEERKSKITN